MVGLIRSEEQHQIRDLTSCSGIVSERMFSFGKFNRDRDFFQLGSAFRILINIRFDRSRTDGVYTCTLATAASSSPPGRLSSQILNPFFSQTYSGSQTNAGGCAGHNGDFLRNIV
ncbi:hypothetical protein QFZ80_005468 [Paenibacillus sp. V4I7]|nr:hypothetical protein [Paenibacillus sp. V4I7]